MKPIFKIALIVLAICVASSIMQIFGGLVCFLMAPILLIIAIVKFSQKKISEAQGYLLGVGISLLIGYSLCSYFPLHIQ